MLNIQIKLKESDALFQSKAVSAIKKRLTGGLRNAAIPITRDVRHVLREAITESSHYNSLLSGTLKGEFGLDDSAQNKLDTIVSTWVNSVIVKVQSIRKAGSQLKGGLNLAMVQQDYADVLSLGGASVATDKGQMLPWLEWLLTMGDKVIIRDYVVQASPRGRSGLAIMVTSPAHQWRVPPEFSGTVRKNWITEILLNIRPVIEDIITKAIRKHLK